MSFIFGGNTGQTPESIRQKRALANAMAAQATGRMPQNLGEGIASASGSIISALMRRRATDAETAGREGADTDFSALLSAYSNPGQTPAPGASPTPAGNTAALAQALSKAKANTAVVTGGGPPSDSSTFTGPPPSGDKPAIPQALLNAPISAPAASTGPAGGGVNSELMAALTKASSNRFLSPAQQNIVSALMGKTLSPPDRKYEKAADGRLRYLDDSAPVFQGVEPAAPDPLSGTGKMLADLERFEPGSPQHQAIQARLRKDSYIAPQRLPDPGAGMNAKADTIMRELGVDRQTAYRVATGVYRTTHHPVTGNAQIIDMTTGALVEPDTRTGGDQQPADMTTQGPMSVGAPDPQIRLDDAYGAMASASEIWNNIGGQFSEDQINPQVAEARTAARLALGSFQRAFAKNPRLPVYEQQRLASLFPSPDAFTSAGSARVALRTIRSELDAYRQDKQRIVGDNSLPAKQRQDAAAALATYDELGVSLDRFDIDGGSSEDAPKTATNPETGETLIFQDGEWRPQ